MIKIKTKENIANTDILNHLSVAIYWKNKDGVYLGCNKQFAKLMGISLSDTILGKTDSTLPWREQIKNIKQYEKAVIENGISKEIELSLSILDKEEKIFLMALSPIRDSKNEICGITGELIDITERKKNELIIQAAKNQAESYLENIIRYMPANIYWKSKAGVILGCNDRLAQSTGLERAEDVNGKTDDELSWKEQAEAIRKNDQNVITTGSPIKFEELATLPDGSVHTFLTIKAPMRDKANNTIAGVVGISVDITDRKEAEQELKFAKERAEVADKLKLDFIHNMEHDIRTPFCGVWQMAALLEDMETDATKKEYAAIIRDSAKLLLKYCNDILKFSRIEAGMHPLIAKKFSVKELVREVIIIETPPAKIKNLSLLVEIAEDVPIILIGDQGKLQRVLLNLVGNAIKFTNEGEIKIIVRLARTIENKSVVVQFMVKDTGLGIPQEKQSIIYEKFMRGTPSNQGIYQGFGLGLYVVKEDIKDMGGEIDIDSQVGKGTTFICTIPFQLPLLEDSGMPKIPVKTLLVENDPDIQRIQVDVLQSFGCTVDIATTGKQALELFSTQQYELVFSALTLPEFDGMKLVKAIRAKEEDKKLPFIALATYKEKDEESHIRAAGADEFIAKPLTQNSCKIILKQYIARFEMD